MKVINLSILDSFCSFSTLFEQVQGSDNKIISKI